MARRYRIRTASTTRRVCGRESARHPSCCYRSREIHACEFAGFVIANFTSDNVFCHSLNLSKEVVSFTEVIYSAGKVWLHLLTSVSRLYGRLILPAELCIQAKSSCSKPVHLAWEQQWGPRKMVPRIQTCSEDAHEKPRSHHTNLTYLNGKRARIIRVAGNYA